MSEWKTYKLGEIADINPRVPLKQGNEYSFVEMKDLNANFKYTSPSIKRELKGGTKFQNGDTLFARITPCLENGKICQVRDLENGVGFGSTEFMVFRGKEKVSDTDFIYYLARTDYVRNNAIQAMTGTSGRQRVEKSALEKLDVLLPDLKTQKTIACILASLDDKIELNLKMNESLESLAKSIFNEWVLNFRFPDFDGVLINGLPKDWKQEPIDNSIEFLNGLALQKFPAENDDDYLPVIKIRELRQGISNASDKANSEIPSKYIINDGDILFSWSGSLEVIIWCDGKGALNQHLFKVSSNVFPKWFCYFWTKHYLPIYQSIAEGKATTMGHIQRRHLTETIINIPDEKTLKKMDKIISPLVDKIILNKIEIKTLARFRDNLLPEIMT
jgi:type I restriction enzyme S subunit